MVFQISCMTGQQIYDNFINGKGGERLSESARSVSNAMTLYNELSTEIRQLTADMESIWEGPAAGAATRGAGPLAVEHELAYPELHNVQELTGRQVGSYNDAKNQVQPVPSVPEEPGFWDNLTSFGGASTNYDQQVQANQAANEHNVRVMQTYEGASLYNGDGMPQNYGQMQPDSSGVVIGERESTETGGGDERGDGGGEVGGFDGGGGSYEYGSRPPGGVSGPTDVSGYTPPPGGGGGGGPGPIQPGPVPPPPGGGGGLMPVQPYRPGNPGQPGVPPRGPGNPGGRGPGVPGGRPGGRGGPGGMRGGGGFGPGAPGAGGPGGGAGGPRGGVGGLGSGGPGAGLNDGNRAGRGPIGAGASAGEAGRGGGAAGGRGTAGGGMGGMGAGAGARGGEDEEHQRAPFLLENDPESLFGTDQITAPPVIGE